MPAEEAEDVLERAYCLAPGDARVVTALAEVLLAAGGPARAAPRRARATRMLEGAATCRPTARALFLLGSAAEDAAEDAAEGELAGAVGGDGAGRQLLSPALRRALACYRRALVIDPQHVASLVSAADLEPSRDAAADLYRRALALQPRQPTCLRNYARLLAEKGEVDRAVGLYEEAALRDPEDIPTLNELALLLWDARHDANTALQTLARALEQAPLDAVVLSNYARVLEESGGDAEQAAGMYRRALDMDPQHVTALCGLACLLASRDESESFKQAAEEVPAGGDTLVETLGAGSSSHGQSQGHSAAITAPASAPPTPHTPTHPHCAEDTAARLRPRTLVAHMLSPSLAAAQELFRRALQVAPYHGGASANLALICEHVGRPTEAQELVAAALHHDPHHPDLLEAKSRLRLKM